MSDKYYRDLKLGEIIQEGDRYYIVHSSTWSQVISCQIGNEYHRELCLHQRPVHVVEYDIYVKQLAEATANTKRMPPCVHFCESIAFKSTISKLEKQVAKKDEAVIRCKQVVATCEKDYKAKLKVKEQQLAEATANTDSVKAEGIRALIYRHAPDGSNPMIHRITAESFAKSLEAKS